MGTFHQTMENPLYNFNTKYWLGRSMLEAHSVRKIFVNKQEKNILGLWNQMKIEDKFVYDGKTLYDFHFDTTVPKKMLKINFLPMEDDMVWDLDSSVEYIANERVDLDFKLLHGDRAVHEAKRSIHVKVNNEEKF